MIDHLGIGVSNIERSKTFYKKALQPLGYAQLMDFGEAAGFGAEGNPDFWIEAGGPQTPPVHVGLVAPDRGVVDRFYSEALAAGGRDNGPPGLRPDYGPDYYAAFVLDPDGHNIEAVCHRP